MIADVWSRQEIAAAIVIIVSVLLFGLGQALDSQLLSLVGGIVTLVGIAVFIAWRVIGGPGDGKPPGAV